MEDKVYDFCTVLPFSLSEEDKHMILQQMCDEFHFDHDEDDLDNLRTNIKNLFLRWETITHSAIILNDQNIQTEKSQILLMMKELQDLYEHLCDNYNITFSRRVYEHKVSKKKRRQLVVSNRWASLWNKQQPFARFKEFCVCELEIKHFPGSLTDRLIRKIYKNNTTDHTSNTKE